MMSSSSEEDYHLLEIHEREWELGPNSTAFDQLRAAPSDEVLQVQWILFIAILSVEAIFMSFVFASILLDKKCRHNSFNTYLLFLTAPDLWFTCSCIVTCSLNVLSSSYYSEVSCHYQSFYCVFAIASSSWLNAILAWQLHKMLYCSQRAVRYYPPTRFRVSVHSLSVYTWSAFVASWATWEADWWPIRNGLYNGVLCLPMPYDRTSVIFFYGIFAPAVFLVPLVYICYLTFDVLRKRLLPPLKQRKTLMIFFRLVLVYFVFWLPAIVIVFIGSNWLPSWWGFGGALWAHLQGAVSAGVCLVKPDIWNACKQLLCIPKRISSDNAQESTPLNENLSSDNFLGIHEEDDTTEENIEEGQRVEPATTSMNNNAVNSVAGAFELGEEQEAEGSP